jgi:hypothetical protein
VWSRIASAVAAPVSGVALAIRTASVWSLMVPPAYPVPSNIDSALSAAVASELIAPTFASMRPPMRAAGSVGIELLGKRLGTHGPLVQVIFNRQFPFYIFHFLVEKPDFGAKIPLFGCVLLDGIQIQADKGAPAIPKSFDQKVQDAVASLQ